MNQESPKFEKGDVVIVSRNAAFNDRDRFAGIVKEVLLESGDSEPHYNVLPMKSEDGELTKLGFLVEESESDMEFLKE